MMGVNALNLTSKQEYIKQCLFTIIPNGQDICSKKKKSQNNNISLISTNHINKKYNALQNNYYFKKLKPVMDEVIFKIIDAILLKSKDKPLT